MRRTELHRKTPMRRTGRLNRTTELRRSSPIKPRMRRPRMPRDVRDDVFARSHGLCDICGLPLVPTIWECHHRRLRSAGGEDRIENLLALHPYCHQHAHEHRTWARERGYIVESGDEPDSVPVWLHSLAWHTAGPAWIPTT